MYSNISHELQIPRLINKVLRKSFPSSLMQFGLMVVQDRCIVHRLLLPLFQKPVLSLFLRE